MRNQNFGIEIELTGLTRKRAAEIMAEHFGTQMSCYGGSYSEYHAKDQSGRTWKAMSDASIHTQNGESVEIVSPICKYEDIPDIQEIVRKLRRAGAVANWHVAFTSTLTQLLTMQPPCEISLTSLPVRKICCIKR